MAVGLGAVAAGAGECCEKAPAAVTEKWGKQWGIEFASLRVSAGGYMVDFRYKVLDAEKAAPLARRDVRPYLLDVATGAKMLVPTTPKVGSLRQTPLKLTPGRIYGAMFANPVQTVKAGSKVTVVIGDVRLENLTVQ
jgi:hypothetical protein